ncbi:hypothetical protein ASC95_22770 [Pelomonas sp. Root1217]|uniref:hypothetical protein n=1 Tax=Pelomonas sp. Root1217 TaxID=1736430 RepID=UPI00070D0BFC|nr:hypothetical protein [Pelomonas sp. Root1217]KQV48725.1 hypothetical protein ASC95_22770 [Pelomonas sp. Root1217]
MKPDARRSPLLFLVVAALTQIARRPYLSVSVAAHAALLALLYYFGSYQLELREQEVEVASSLRATSVASTAKRLQDLQTIKELLQKSADRVPAEAQPGPAAAAAPETPDRMVERARELAKEIDALDKDIRAEELAKLTGLPKTPPPVAETVAAGDDSAALEPKEAGTQAEAREPHDAQAKAGQGDATKPGTDGAAANMQAPMTPETAASEVAALEAKARATLVKRQQRLEAKTNGVQVEAGKSGAGGEGTGGDRSGSPAAGRGTDRPVLAEITDFISAGERVEQTTRSWGYFGQDGQIFDRGKGQIPPVDATHLVRGHGRMFGAGGEYANRVYLNSWYFIGPFPGRHGAGMFDNPAYPPEQAVLLDAVYYGKDKRLLKWRYVTAQSYPFLPPEQAQDSVYYGYTEVFVDEACDLTAWIGADDDVQVYLNGRMVWKGGNVNKQSYFDDIFLRDAGYVRDYNRTEGKRVLHFNKGRNKLFFKLSNGPNDAFLSMVLTR